MASLASLIVQVEKATEPDRLLDHAIAEACGLRRIDENIYSGTKTTWHDGKHKVNSHFTASLDASLALVERVCPKDWQWGEVLHDALRLLSKKYGWHVTFSRPEQLKELPRLAREDSHV